MPLASYGVLQNTVPTVMMPSVNIDWLNECKTWYCHGISNLGNQNGVMIYTNSRSYNTQTCHEKWNENVVAAPPANFSGPDLCGAASLNSSGPEKCGAHEVACVALWVCYRPSCGVRATWTGDAVTYIRFGSWIFVVAFGFICRGTERKLPVVMWKWMDRGISVAAVGFICRRRQMEVLAYGI